MTATSTKGLRFALLARVSTKRQEEKGESLQDQGRRLRDGIARLGGRLYKDYSGQEGATPGKARPKLDELLRDAEASRFDALIVDDGSRWSRDNTHNREALKLLRERGIRFFDLGREYDLNNPQDRMILGILAEINEMTYAVLGEKSVRNRIERARRGWITVGKGPYGRHIANDTVQKRRDEGVNAQWAVDPKAKRFAERAYALYVERGLTFDEVGEKLDVPGQTVRRRLLDGGDRFVQEFAGSGRKPVEVVTKIPALLTPEQLAAIHASAKERQQYRPSKLPYPLAHYVKCAACGSLMSGKGRRNKDGTVTRYYFHWLKKPLSPRCTSYVRAAELEREFFAQMGAALKTRESLADVVRAAIATDPDKAEDLREENARLEADARKRERDRRNIVNAIASGAIKSSLLRELQARHDEAAKQLEGIAARRREIADELSAHEVPKDVIDRVHSALGWIAFHPRMPMHWPPKVQKELARMFFGGNVKGKDGRGLYVATKRDRQLGDYWTFDAHGLMEASGVVGRLGAVLDVGRERGVVIDRKRRTRRPVEPSPAERGLTRRELMDLARSIDRLAGKMKWKPRNGRAKASLRTYTRTSSTAARAPC